MRGLVRRHTACRAAWAPRTAPRRTTPARVGRQADGVYEPRGWPVTDAPRRSVVLATLAQYLGIVEALADQADQADADDGGGETMH